MNRQNILKTAIMLAATLLIAACTNDEMADSQPETLPEGQYPLEIASVTMSANAPQSRVVENSNDGMSSAWEWNGTEKIGVQLYADGDVATYTLNNNQTLTPDKTLYWKNTEQTTVMAWYPVETEVSLTNQKDKLAYVLKGSGEGNCNSSITLNFTHALAKVRVTLQGDQAEKVENIQIKSLTSCTHTKGTVSTKDTQEDWIMMKPTTYNGVKYWEANVVADHKITDFQVNGVSNKLNNDGITPLAAKVNTITLIVGNQEITGGGTIDKPGNYIIKSSITQTVILKGNGINLTLDNVTATNVDTPIKIESGTPVIKVTGTNTFTTKNGSTGILLDGNDANVEIIGNGPANSSLQITVPNATKGTAAGSPAIGSYGEYNSCGNIKISNITLIASGNGNEANNYSAAIGTGAGFSASCGSITIENSIINASAKSGAAAIGFGVVYDGGNIHSITINNSQLNLTVTGEGAGIGFGWNVDDMNQSIGAITITSNEDEKTFFNRFNVSGYKVGKSSRNYSNQTWQGFTFNGKSLASGSDNGYK